MPMPASSLNALQHNSSHTGVLWAGIDVEDRHPAPVHLTYMQFIVANEIPLMEIARMKNDTYMRVDECHEICHWLLRSSA